MRNALVIAGVLALSLVGCGEKNETTTSGAPVEASQVTAASQEAPAAKPHGNKNTAVSDYSELDSALPLIMTYYNLTGLPPAFDEMAKLVSADYANENDAFKKQDIFKVLKPKLQTDMQALTARPYLVLSDRVSLSPYDVNQRMFPVSGTPIDQENLFFPDSAYVISRYAMVLENRTEFSTFKVSDENKAREIESVRSQQPSQEYEAKFYLYARDAKDLQGSKRVYFEVMKVVVKKPDGTVFFEY